METNLKELEQHSELYLLQAQRLVDEGKMILAAVALHKHCESLLKFKALQLTGTVPETHSLKILLRYLEKHNTMVRQLLSNKNYFLRLNRIEVAKSLPNFPSVRYNKDVLPPFIDFTREIFENLGGEISPP